MIYPYSGKSKTVHCILYCFKTFNHLIRLLTHFNEIIQIKCLEEFLANKKAMSVLAVIMIIIIFDCQDILNF